MSFTSGYVTGLVGSFSTSFIGGAGDEFSPIDVGTIAFWSKHDETDTITDSANAISQIDDQSGNTNNITQGTSSNKSTTNVTTTNGMNTTDWDGNDYMTFDTPIDHTNGYTVFFAIDNLADNGVQKGLVTGDTGSLLYRIDNEERPDVVRTGQAVLVSGSTTVSSAPNVVSMKASAAGNASYINGVSDGSNATNAALTQPLTTIGGVFGNFYTGSIGEIIIYTGVLTDAEHEQVGNYLANKWTTLPSVTYEGDTLTYEGDIVTYAN